MFTNPFLDKTSNFLIAADGEAASGKGTLSKRLASEFNLFYCQTSIFYRKLARIAIDNNVNDIGKLAEIARELAKLESVSEKLIYTEEVGNKASEIAAIGEIREALNIPQRDILKMHKRMIMEGRDIGTVIAPNADAKLYIKADIEVRAKRRYEERVSGDPSLTFQKVKNDLLERDKRDKERKESPLVIASDAIIIDNSYMDMEQFFQKAVELISNQFC